MKIELNDVSSNLLLASSIMVATLPLLLGDQLVPIVSDALRQAGTLMDGCTAYLTYLLS